ncbi:MAG: gephyrin-like molybdotransferase Glp [Gemmatimonadota bacterium]|nr:gephyrin-like molybdotransferase Glp [Gemmatimonadota bacterium]
MTGAPGRYQLDVAEAMARVVAGVARLGTERLPTAAARGRVLAAPVHSPVNLPPWNNSAMDGYAVRSADIAAVPATLRVIETVAAGAFPTRAPGPGEATRIMTGAPVPEGADTVVRVEDTDGGRQRVVIRDNRDAGRNVRPAGEDVRAGTEALPAGAVLGAAQLGLLAAVGAAEVEVVRQPRVAIISSGDELVPPERFAEVVAGRKIVSSNSVTLHELVRDAGGEPVDLGIAADTHESLREHLARAEGVHLVLTSGGISVGEFDYVREVLAERGATLDFWRVRMRPGAPIGFGELDGTPWIGLPGNPVSTMVTFELFVRPAIRVMRGHAAPFPATVGVVLGEPVTVGADLTHFLRVTLAPEGGHLVARLTGAQSSGMLSSMARADALLVLPRGVREAPAGAALRAIPLGREMAFSPAPALA